jgi:glycogen debranching enzyme
MKNVKNVNRLRPRSSHQITYEGESSLITDLKGFISGGVEGFYYRQTRFLSKLRFAVDGADPLFVSTNAVDPYSSIAYYLAPSPGGASAGPSPDEPDGGEMVRRGIAVQINALLGGGLHLDVYVTNHALIPARIGLSWQLDADFADRAEAGQGERQQNAPVDRHWRSREGGGELVFSYRHPQLSHGCELRFSGPGELTEGELTERDAAVRWTLNLPPQQPAALGIDVVPVFCGERVGLRRGQDAFNKPAIVLPGEGVRLSTDNQRVQHAWDRALADLVSLARLEGEGEERLTPAAGVPKYLGLFGRDVLLTGFQASFPAPAVLRGSLRTIARWNAVKYDERFDEEPGRVIHQRELGPLSLLEKEPFLHYYGDYTAPGLFLIDLAWDLALTGDKEFFLSMRDKALATLDWMERDGDSDGDGLYEYDTKAGAWGEKNQGWKDSEEAILYEDGRLVRNPITLVEIQGCYYAAKQLAGLAFASVGEDGRAARLLAEAEALKRRFNERFWMPDLQYFGLALDPDKNLVRTIAADPGQCLAYGAIDDDKAEAVAARLMAPDLFSGWGIRTLSDRHPAFNPFAYHLGSVWPAANSIIGFGLKRYGFDEELHRLAKAMFDATEIFDFDRLPEVIGGNPRDRRHPHPGVYPDTNSPQAWSAGAVMLLIQSMLGLIPVAPRQTLIIDPSLPEWLPELTLRNIRVGRARLSLRFFRDGSGHTDHQVIDRDGEELRIHRPAASERGTDRFAMCMRDAVLR